AVSHARRCTPCSLLWAAQAASAVEVAVVRWVMTAATLAALLADAARGAEPGLSGDDGRTALWPLRAGWGCVSPGNETGIVTALGEREASAGRGADVGAAAQASEFTLVLCAAPPEGGPASARIVGAEGAPAAADDDNGLADEEDAPAPWETCTDLIARSGAVAVADGGGGGAGVGGGGTVAVASRDGGSGGEGELLALLVARTLGRAQVWLDADADNLDTGNDIDRTKDGMDGEADEWASDGAPDSDGDSDIGADDAYDDANVVAQKWPLSASSVRARARVAGARLIGESLAVLLFSRSEPLAAGAAGGGGSDAAGCTRGLGAVLGGPGGGVLRLAVAPLRPAARSRARPLGSAALWTELAAVVLRGSTARAHPAVRTAAALALRVFAVEALPAAAAAGGALSGRRAPPPPLSAALAAAASALLDVRLVPMCARDARVAAWQARRADTQGLEVMLGVAASGLGGALDAGTDDSGGDSGGVLLSAAAYAALCGAGVIGEEMDAPRHALPQLLAAACGVRARAAAARASAHANGFAAAATEAGADGWALATLAGSGSGFGGRTPLVPDLAAVRARVGRGGGGGGGGGRALLAAVVGARRAGEEATAEAALCTAWPATLPLLVAALRARSLALAPHLEIGDGSGDALTVASAMVAGVAERDAARAASAKRRAALAEHAAAVRAARVLLEGVGGVVWQARARAALGAAAAALRVESASGGDRSALAALDIAAEALRR
ncbi:hypothetical protein T492DRAFT_879738, partial [Pavlovales sp. CCMP2436]